MIAENRYCSFYACNFHPKLLDAASILDIAWWSAVVLCPVYLESPDVTVLQPRPPYPLLELVV